MDYLLHTGEAGEGGEEREGGNEWKGEGGERVFV